MLQIHTQKKEEILDKKCLLEKKLKANHVLNMAN